MRITGAESVEQLIKVAYDYALHLTMDEGSLAALLERYVSGEISSAQMVAIADALEVNESVSVEGPLSSLINGLLFEIANPEINGALDASRASEIIDTLNKA